MRGAAPVIPVAFSARLSEAEIAGRLRWVTLSRVVSTRPRGHHATPDAMTVVDATPAKASIRRALIPKRRRVLFFTTGGGASASRTFAGAPLLLDNIFSISFARAVDVRRGNAGRKIPAGQAKAATAGDARAKE